MDSDKDVQKRLNAALTGRYRIDSEIGSGGMATVYLAQDLRHDRKVAVKVLKPELAAVVGTERFLAEIRTTANLSHPNILPLFDSGEANGFLFYVMPYVEGESLRARLDRDGQLPVEEALRIAGRVADALDSAHRHHVIHRDVKPGNILFQEGEPVVSDFGIALAVSSAGEGRLTETGLSLGTPYYMSPEQAAGEATPSAASDIYSLACVLYEMLTGEPPHTGASAQAILGKIFLGEVTPPTKLRRTIPVNVEAAILKALERVPADRFESGGQFTAALQDKGFRHGAGIGAAAAAGPWKAVAAALAGLTIMSAAFALKLALTPEASSPAFLQQEIRLPEYASGVSRWDGRFALAPDGSSYVYADTAGLESGWRLWLKERDEIEARPLLGTEGAGQVTYSPDGEWIAFAAGAVPAAKEILKRSLRREGNIPLLTGVDPNDGGSLSWLDDGTVLCGQGRNTLVRVPDDGGGRVDTVFVFPEEEQLMRVRGLPGGRGALALSYQGLAGTGWILRAMDLQGGTSRVLLEGMGVKDAWYVEPGYLVWVQQDGSVFAAPFDAGELNTSGDVQPLLGGVQGDNFFPGMVLGKDGTVVYKSGTSDPTEFSTVWVDRENRVEPIPTGLKGILWMPDLSPDGTRLAVQVTSEEGTEVWTARTDRESPRPISSGPGLRPSWTPDGEWVIYTSRQGEEIGLWKRRADGSGDPEPLPHPELDLNDVSMSPDSAWMIAGTRSAGGERDIVGWRVGVDPVPVLLVPDAGMEMAPALSHDGRFLAYVSDETGARQVYVRPFPNTEDWVHTASVGGGMAPVWSRDGRELFYVGADALVAVEVREENGIFDTGEERFVFTGPFAADIHPEYDVSPDGQRFVAIQTSDVNQETRMVMILNFFTLLEERVGGRD
jgi:serine/threonine-protein kinase